MGLKALGEIVPGLVKKIGVSDKSFQIMSLIEREIQKSSPRAQVMSYKNNKLYVEVESSVQLFELNLKKREILKILSGIPSFVCPDLRFFLKGTARPTAKDRLKGN